MKLLANENIPMGMVRRLRDMGHDVLAVGETSPDVADAVQQVALWLADEGKQVQGYFVVMDRDCYRRRPLPGTVT